jgi:hypothetical protein
MNARIFFAALALTAQVATSSALDLGVSASLSPSPLYSWRWDPGIDGEALALDASQDLGPLDLRAGLEAGISGIGAQLLLPIRVERRLWSSGASSIGAEVGALPGLALFTPRPLFMIGGEAGLSYRWSWAPRWSFEATLALRYLACPGYSALVSDYQVVDLPLAVGVRYRIGSSPSR